MRHVYPLQPVDSRVLPRTARWALTHDLAPFRTARRIFAYVGPPLPCDRQAYLTYDSSLHLAALPSLPGSSLGTRAGHLSTCPFTLNSGVFSPGQENIPGTSPVQLSTPSGNVSRVKTRHGSISISTYRTHYTPELIRALASEQSTMFPTSGNMSRVRTTPSTSSKDICGTTPRAEVTLSLPVVR